MSAAAVGGYFLVFRDAGEVAVTTVADLPASDDADTGGIAEDEEPASADVRQPAESPSPDDSREGATSDEDDTGTASTTTTGSREATLFAGIAKIRDRPGLDGREVAVITNRMGAPLTVFGGHVDGWYEVQIDGYRGWLFGSFVLPPADGLNVGETVDERPAVLRDSAGRRLGFDNPSGNKVLVIDTSDPSLWRVLVPDGTTAYVSAADIHLVGH